MEQKKVLQSKSIQEFAVGDRVQNFFIIKTMEIRKNKNNKDYADLTLGDKTGEISTKIWDLNNLDMTSYKENMLIKARGRVTQWQSQLQLNIERMRPTTE